MSFVARPRRLDAGEDLPAFKAALSAAIAASRALRLLVEDLLACSHSRSARADFDTTLRQFVDGSFVFACARAPFRYLTLDPLSVQHSVMRRLQPLSRTFVTSSKCAQSNSGQPLGFLPQRPNNRELARLSSRWCQRHSYCCEIRTFVSVVGLSRRQRPERSRRPVLLPPLRDLLRLVTTR